MTHPYEEGSYDARICLIGEAPAKTEISFNRPFVGPSGKLLDDMLHEAGIPRQACLILNVFEDMIFKPKGKEDEIYSNDGELLYRARSGFTALGMVSLERLYRRLERSRANVFVPLGGTALAALFGASSITKWRGSILKASPPRIAGRKIVGTYHPTWLFHGNMIHKYTVVNDLKRVAQEAMSPKLNLPERQLLVDPTWPEVVDFFRLCKESKRIATDIEVLNRHVSCFSVATTPQLCMSVPLLNAYGEPRWPEEEEVELWRLYADIMGDKKIEKINQNIIFDISVLQQRNNIFTYGPIQDPMLAQHLIYPDFPKSLAFLCSVYTREPYYKDDGKIWASPWKDMEKFWLYNARDAACALEIWDELYKELVEGGYMQLYQNMIDTFPAFMYMSLHGIKLNKTRLEEQKIEAKAEIVRLRKELTAIAEWDFNPLSPKQCCQYFYITKELQPITDRKTGKPTSDDAAMARIYKRWRLREAKLVQEIRGMEKMSGTYLEVIYDDDERVRCSYNPYGAITGRPSSSQTVWGTGMNFNNLTPAFKDFLEADGP